MAPVKKIAHVRARTFIKEWRKHRHMSQEEAAAHTKVDRTTFGRIERRILPYNQDFLERLADACKCTVLELLTVNPFKPRVDDVAALLAAAPPEVRAFIIQSLKNAATQGQ